MDLLRGKTLLKKTGDTFQEIPAIEALRNTQVVGFYFSAHWCVPCRSFTPCLVDCYQELRTKKKPFEIVFVSADESPESAKTYMKESHGEWMSTVFEDTDLHDALAKTFAVIRIPQLIIVKRNGQVITSNGCRDVKELGGEAFSSWIEGKSAVRSQEQVGTDEDLLDRLVKHPSSKLQSHLGASNSDIVGESDVTGPCGDEATDELSKSLEKAGIHTSGVEKDKIKSNPTRMLTIRDVEKHATENSATSSGGKKNVKGTVDTVKDVDKPKNVVKESEESGIKELTSAAGSVSTKTNTEGKDKLEVKGKTLIGEGGSTSIEKPQKIGKSEAAKKRKRTLKKRSVGSKEKDKKETTPKSEEPDVD